MLALAHATSVGQTHTTLVTIDYKSRYHHRMCLSLLLLSDDDDRRQLVEPVRCNNDKRGRYRLDRASRLVHEIRMLRLLRYVCVC